MTLRDHRMGMYIVAIRDSKRKTGAEPYRVANVVTSDAYAKRRHVVLVYAP